MVRFSYAHIPAYPLDESIKLIKVADELGYYAAYACDETWWKDMWLLFAAAARETKQIRLGPNVTHVILRDPAHIVQMLGTLDELSGGRAECVVSSGNQSLLPQHGIDLTGMKPLSRVIEAHEVAHGAELDRQALLYGTRQGPRPGVGEERPRMGRPAFIPARRREVRRAASRERARSTPRSSPTRGWREILAAHIADERCNLSLQSATVGGDRGAGGAGDLESGEWRAG